MAVGQDEAAGRAGAATTHAPGAPRRRLDAPGRARPLRPDVSDSRRGARRGRGRAQRHRVALGRPARSPAAARRSGPRPPARSRRTATRRRRGSRAPAAWRRRRRGQSRSRRSKARCRRGNASSAALAAPQVAASVSASAASSSSSSTARSRMRRGSTRTTWAPAGNRSGSDALVGVEPGQPRLHAVELLALGQPLPLRRAPRLAAIRATGARRASSA